MLNSIPNEPAEYRLSVASRWDTDFPPIVDAPDDWRSDHSAVGEAIKARRKPTPPDFDAAVTELEMAINRRCDWLNSPYGELGDADDSRTMGIVFAAHQSVRELHEAVVRERDAARQNVAKLCRDINEEFTPEIRRLNEALRAAQQGEEYPVHALPVVTVKGGLTGYKPIGMVILGDTFTPGDKVRITRVEEAP